MFQLFVDESGTDAKSNVIVLAGVLSHRTFQSPNARIGLDRLKDYLVPQQFRDGFIFHAKDLFCGERSREYSATWSIHERSHLLQQVSAIPRNFGHQLILAYCRRQPELYVGRDPKEVAHIEHVMAWGALLSQADKLISSLRAEGLGLEVIAEQVPELQDFLLRGADVLRAGINLGPGSRRQTVYDIALNRAAEPVVLELKTLDRPIRFLAKEEEPIFQIADACAYVFRRWLEGRSGGGYMGEMVMNELCDIRDYGPSGAVRSAPYRYMLSEQIGWWTPGVTLFGVPRMAGGVRWRG